MSKCSRCNTPTEHKDWLYYRYTTSDEPEVVHMGAWCPRCRSYAPQVEVVPEPKQESKSCEGE